MLTAGRDGWFNLWNLYCARNTWGGQNGWDRVTLAVIHLCCVWEQSLCAFWCPCMRSLNHQQQFFRQPNLIRLCTCNSHMKGKIRIKQQTLNSLCEASVSGIYLPLQRTPGNKLYINEQICMCSTCSTFIWSQLIPVCLQRQCSVPNTIRKEKSGSNCGTQGVLINFNSLCMFVYMSQRQH